jgi:septal ring factor EnvC (AmiA/AmiB activator)
MSDTVDLTLLSGNLQSVERELRLVRVQVDSLASTLPARMDGIDARLASLEARVGGTEHSVHDLAAEMARGFGQIQQQLTRHERRFDVLDAGLAALSRQLAETGERLIQIMTQGPEER